MPVRSAVDLVIPERVASLSFRSAAQTHEFRSLARSSLSSLKDHNDPGFWGLTGTVARCDIEDIDRMRHELARNEEAGLISKRIWIEKDLALQDCWTEALKNLEYTKSMRNEVCESAVRDLKEDRHTADSAFVELLLEKFDKGPKERQVRPTQFSP